MGCLAHTEAVIDFGDDDREDDVSDSALKPLIPRVQQLRNELSIHLSDGRRGELVREGVRVALAGPPNAGKSSLMNALARRPAAIVSPIAGTTRDVVEVRLELAGVPCIVSDTAGLRAESSDVIEIEGMRRARDAFSSAQIKVFVIDASDPISVKAAGELLTDLVGTGSSSSGSSSSGSGSERGSGLSDDWEEEVEEEEEGPQAGSQVLVVYNKADLNTPDIVGAYWAVFLPTHSRAPRGRASRPSRRRWPPRCAHCWTAGTRRRGRR
jgi:GTPase SAR1 family protein